MYLVKAIFLSATITVLSLVAAQALMKQDITICEVRPFGAEMTFTDGYTSIDDMPLVSVSKENIHLLRQLAVAHINHSTYGSGHSRVVFSSDGMRVATSDYFTDGSTPNEFTLLWNLAGSNPCFAQFQILDADVIFDSFSSDGQKLLTFSWRGHSETTGRGPYRIYEAYSGEEIAAFRFAEFVNSPDGEVLAYTTLDNSERHIWNLAHPLEAHSQIDEIGATAFSPDANFYVRNEANGGVSLYHAQTHELITTFGGRYSFGFRPFFGPSGKWIVLTKDVTHVEVWNVDKGHLQLAPDAQIAPTYQFTSDSEKFARASQVWDIKTGNVFLDLGDNVFEGYSIDETLLAATSNGKASFLDARTGQLIFAPDVENTITNVEFSPNGKLVLFATSLPSESTFFNIRTRLELWGVFAE